MTKQNRASHPLHTWRIPVDPENSERFWMVVIFETVDELNRWVYRHKTFVRQFRGTRLGACCAEFHFAKRDPGRTFLGYVLFAAPLLTPGIVAHEMVHAANAYLTCGKRRHGARLTAKREEKHAQLVQGLCDCFWKKWWRYGEPKAKRWREKNRRKSA